MKQPPLVVIVGPTASGKTALAIKLAAACNGEIICADSRTVYKGLNIGTAKPTPAERARVPHWGLDVVEPNETFTAADFKRYAVRKISEIRARGRVPFLVGGTGLYIDAVIFNYAFGPPADQTYRQKLEQMNISELHTYCLKNNITLPDNYQNKRYVIRAIERNDTKIKRKLSILANTIIVGITTDKGLLRQRIKARSEQIFDDNVVNEATLLGKNYGWNNEAMTGNIYKIVRQHLSGELSLIEAKAKFTTLDWQLAKRQLTWFKRNPYIWWGELTEAERYITRRLVK